MTILLTLFAAGVLTILLPCILPLVPIVLGASLSGRNKWRPLVTATGMAASFVAFTFVLQVLLRQFVELADLVRVATYYTLLLFGIAFLTSRPRPQIAVAALGALPCFWGQALPQLPKLARAPELSGLGPWYNSPPLTLAALKGKVVLVDFWTYS